MLGIGINSAEGLTNRAAIHKDSSWYNMQGRDHPITGGIPGSVLSADLYIPASWGNAVTNGNVKTDMWGVMTDGTTIGNDYAIIGFTNYGGAPRFQYYDGNAEGWNKIDTPVTYDAWNTFAIKFTGTSYIYSINGSQVYVDKSINGSVGFSWVDMQAYNFYDSTLKPLANAVDYTAYWSNTPAPAPIPASVVLLGTGLFALGLVSRRKFFKK